MVNRIIFKLGLQSTVAHNIAQNLNADSGFDLRAYVEECWELFVAAGMEEDMVTETLEEAIEQAKAECAMGFVQSYGSAQLHPSASYEYAIEQYRKIYNK